MTYKCKGTVRTISMAKNGNVDFTIRAKSTIEGPGTGKTFNVVVDLGATPQFEGFEQDGKITAEASFLDLLMASRECEATFELERTATGWDLQSLELGN